MTYVSLISFNLFIIVHLRQEEWHTRYLKNKRTVSSVSTAVCRGIHDIVQTNTKVDRRTKARVADRRLSRVVRSQRLIPRD